MFSTRTNEGFALISVHVKVKIDTAGIEKLRRIGHDSVAFLKQPYNLKDNLVVNLTIKG